MTTRRPSRCSASIGFAVGWLDRVRHADQSRGPAVDRHEHDRLPVARAARPRARSEPAGSMPSSCKMREIADRDACPVDTPLTPLPVDRGEVFDRRAARCRARARRATMAAASGCSLTLLEARGEPQQRRFVDASARLDGDQRGLALGQRAGLVDDEGRRPSPGARAPRRCGSGHPASAPRPVPTMIDIGVARPSAHGQAMIRTATAFTSAWARRGSGPKSAQTTNVTTATSMTTGTNHAGHRSASR